MKNDIFEMETRKKIRSNMLRIMDRDGISQAELARRLDVDDRTIGHYIHMQRTPSVHRANELAIALGIGLDELLK